MKNHALLLSLALLPSSLAWANQPEWETKTELVHETTTSVEILLNDKTVLCSAADYSGLFLKVLIPKLAALTLLDHQNIGAGAPCVAAGACAPIGEHSPQNIIDPQKPLETVDITVRATRVNDIYHKDKKCFTSLSEDVSLTIRGIAFFHNRFAALGERPYNDCL
jgi:hypothetical protein